MEPVPETERMEEFKASPLPLLRVPEKSVQIHQVSDRGDSPGKPPNIRRSTEPTPSSPLSPGWTSPSVTYRPRNTSPYARGHMRSKSSQSALAPTMSRAQSMPGVNGAGHLLVSPFQRSASPTHSQSPSRIRTPRKPADEVFPGLPSRGVREANELISPISLSSEDHTPKAPERSSSPIMGLNPNANYRIRRPASPLRYVSGGTTPTTPSSLSSSSIATSPSYQNTRFNDSYVGTYSYPGSFASSSVPSTPTSARSRSPSISSLETIPDSPDAEEAALEAERIAQLKAAADAADGIDALDAKAKGLDVSGGRGRTLNVGFGSRDKRKRWSVCGAERRGDLNLDTIWED